MKIYKYPDRKDWPAIVGRQTAGSPDGIRETVADIMEDVRTGGDSKVLEYVEKSGAVPPGMYSPTVSKGTFFWVHITPGEASIVMS